MEINKDILLPYLIFNDPFQYNEQITLYPVKMTDVILFQTLSKSITVRKNSIFHDKKIIKMTYFDFLKYSFENKELESQYQIQGLSQFFFYSIQLLHLCCKDSDIKINQETGDLFINKCFITPEIFDDIRKIIIIQNDIDFDIDEFLNYDTEQRLLKAENDQNKDKDNADIEDYIDSLVISMKTIEETVKNMTIRKFWRYIKRDQLHENYIVAKTGECSGMVSYKTPIKNWRTSLTEDDKYKNLKTDENELKSKIE